MEQYYQYCGAQAVDITSAGFLHDPELLFRVVNSLNQRYSDDFQVGIELYATVSDLLVERARAIGLSLGIDLPIPVSVTYDRVRQWEMANPKARVVRVHGDFSYNEREQWLRLFRLNKMRRPRQFILDAGMTYAFTPAIRQRAVYLAQELGVGMNLHGNIAWALTRDGQMSQLKKRLPFIWVENGMGDESKLDHRANGLADPEEIIKQFVVPEDLGLMLAADHIVDLNRDLLEPLDSPLVRAYLEGIHVARANHGLIKARDPQYRPFFEKLATTWHSRPVRIVYDNNPLELRKYSFDELVDLFYQSINWIRQIQERA